MNTALAYEAQKAVIEERLRKATLVQHQVREPDQTKRRVAARVPLWSALRGYAPRRFRPA